MDSNGNKEKCIQRARELAVEYQTTLVGCAHGSFAATVDALREFGIELVTPEVEDIMFKGLVGLTGGLGNMNTGTCGAVTGSSFAVSLACNITRELTEQQGKGMRWIAYYNVADGVANRFIEKYGSIVCRDIQLRIFGMAFDSRVPGRNKELFGCASKHNCQTPGACTIANGAGWAAERIWDMVHNPKDLTWVISEHEK
ncbi:MAG TPA: C-GCAxxG-C-C family protein [Bacillota bacterium]|jgi:hypothetical protein|nr:C-GCAxxG-C-C family protein [Bacillota bacterium]